MSALFEDNSQWGGAGLTSVFQVKEGIILRRYSYSLVADIQIDSPLKSSLRSQRWKGPFGDHLVPPLDPSEI
jgi:hypothetical protein